MQNEEGKPQNASSGGDPILDADDEWLLLKKRHNAINAINAISANNAINAINAIGAFNANNANNANSANSANNASAYWREVGR